MSINHKGKKSKRDAIKRQRVGWWLCGAERESYLKVRCALKVDSHHSSERAFS
jgi:hypothetical protein